MPIENVRESVSTPIASSSDEVDILDKYRNTSKLYKEIEQYLSKHVTKDTPLPVAMVWINKCINRFVKRKKIKSKVIRLCIYYLDKIEYPL